jgi:hypothetical protein
MREISVPVALPAGEFEPAFGVPLLVLAILVIGYTIYRYLRK